MSDVFFTGLFSVLGAFIGGAAAVFATKIDRKWQKAEGQIRRLCHELEAFHKLEELYKEEVAKLRPEHASAKTIQDEMRTQVEKLDGYKRPSITPSDIKKILIQWE